MDDGSLVHVLSCSNELCDVESRFWLCEAFAPSKNIQHRLVFNGYADDQRSKASVSLPSPLAYTWLHSLQE